MQAILGVGVHRDAKIIIKRKYIQGGGAMITPERAPARLVSVQEDVREVMLTRYGGDVEVNLNHFGIPEDAQEELDMKVNHQKRELERQLVNIGYETLMREGTMLQDAIVRSNPSITDAHKAQEACERITTRMLFGCTSKYSFPVQNILAACKYASAYSVSGRRGSVLVLPHGLPELLRYTKPDRMKYSISGLTQSQTSKPIDMELDNVVVDPSTGVRIMTHIPQPSFQHGAVLEPEPSPLQNRTIIRMMYNVKINETKILDFSTGSLRTVSAIDIFKLFDSHDLDAADVENGGDGRDETSSVLTPGGALRLEFRNGNGGEKNVYTIVRTVEFMMSSAILAVPGSGTGELLFAYPQTGVSTNIASESMLIKLRVYLGAALYQPEDVLIIPDVAFEGIVSGANWINGITWGMLGTFPHLAAPAPGQPNNPMNAQIMDLTDQALVQIRNGGAYPGGGFDQYTPLARTGKLNLVDALARDTFTDSQDSQINYTLGVQAIPPFLENPTVIYPGSTFDRNNTPLEENTGHLNGLEDAKGWNSFFGNCGGQVYSNNITP